MNVCVEVDWRLGSSSAQRKAPGTHHERRCTPRKAGDGVCRYSVGGTEGVERNGSDGKPEALSLFRARRSSRSIPKL